MKHIGCPPFLRRQKYRIDRMPSISPGAYRESVSVAKPGSSIVVFSDVDGVLRAPHTQAFTTAAAVFKQLCFDDTALVLCSGKTRAELEFVQQRLDITQPFICENGSAVIIPNGCFEFPVANSRGVAGCRAVEFGRTYAEVVDMLHRTADRLRIELVAFSDMSIEEVARERRLPLLQARLAKLRDYEELFRLVDPSSSARARLFKALEGVNLRGREGDRFDRVGAPVSCAVGVNLVTSLYQRSRGDVITVGVTDTTSDDNLLRLMNHLIMAPSDEPSGQPIDVVDWAESIVDRVKELCGQHTTSARGVMTRDM
jgi:predicted mannosyl-3-phosphoglycerate phosphatase (HAD superfamily)